jgi:hypothetical protein
VRFALTLLLIAVASTTAAAQTTLFGVRVEVPDYIGIRLVGDGTGARTVTFDYAANPDAYLAAVANGTALSPTDVARFDDVLVNTTRNGRWRVQAVATELVHAGPTSGTGIELSDVRFERSRDPDPIFDLPGNSAGYLESWTLSASATEIAYSRGATGGWRSLGISGWDYRLVVDGDEAPGTYTTVVTFFLTAP